MSTLLDGVNAVLKKVDVLDDSGLLTSLTDSARQSYVDAAVQSLNEAIDHLYALSEIPKPTSLGEEWITLVEGDRSYGLDDTLITLRREYHLIDETNNHVISILGEDGYRQIVFGDIEQNDTGLPSCAAVSPVDGELIMDRIPTANETGKRYKYRFEKDLELTTATDEFPLQTCDQTAQMSFPIHRPIRANDQQRHRFPHGHICHCENQVAKQVDGRAICPVEVLYGNDGRAALD